MSRYPFLVNVFVVVLFRVFTNFMYIYRSNFMFFEKKCYKRH